MLEFSHAPPGRPDLRPQVGAELLGVDIAADVKRALTHGARSDEFSDVLDEIVAERAPELPRDLDFVGRE